MNISDFIGMAQVFAHTLDSLKTDQQQVTIDSKMEIVINQT